ncbi:MAG: ClbS/DfsB family four-helix bundle protein [Tepidiformaceae bacterium]
MTRSENPADATVAELLERIAEARAVLDEVVAPLSDAERERSLGGAWSVKLHLAHIADWEVGILALLRHESGVEAMGLTEALWKGGDTDAMNEAMATRAEQTSLDEVLSRYGNVHRELVSQIEGMADSDLQLPYSHFHAGANEGDTAPILGWIAGNTFGHYPEHAQWITEGLADG